jgi:hypothetical protein
VGRTDQRYDKSGYEKRCQWTGPQVQKNFALRGSARGKRRKAQSPPTADSPTSSSLLLTSTSQHHAARCIPQSAHWRPSSCGQAVAFQKFAMDASWRSGGYDKEYFAEMLGTAGGRRRWRRRRRRVPWRHLPCPRSSPSDPPFDDDGVVVVAVERCEEDDNDGAASPSLSALSSDGGSGGGGSRKTNLNDADACASGVVVGDAKGRGGANDRVTDDGGSGGGWRAMSAGARSKNSSGSGSVSSRSLRHRRCPQRKQNNARSHSDMALP